MGRTLPCRTVAWQAGLSGPCRTRGRAGRRTGRPPESRVLLTEEARAAERVGHLAHGGGVHHRSTGRAVLPSCQEAYDMADARPQELSLCPAVTLPGAYRCREERADER
ncbi:hypothetical protein GCM10023336_17370 [Streptomyces similanensis]|uniref:Uncharacterized protein n=1 Tax=Streptomyces similanensis TaxID=1274988 RepID=A0ABP9K2G8_9ACTN